MFALFERRSTEQITEFPLYLTVGRGKIYYQIQAWAFRGDVPHSGITKINIRTSTGL